ncbi:MAG: ribonuclease III [bacterium]
MKLLRYLFAKVINTSVESQCSPASTDSSSAEKRARLEEKLGYRFKDQELLKCSLLHRSHVHVSGFGRQDSNERLEFLGDAVLGLVVNEFLFQRFPRRAEGDLTKMKSLLVCGNRLSEVAALLNLGEHIRMSRSEAATGGRKRSSILADTMEAIIGAVYLDGGLLPADAVIKKCLLDNSTSILTKRSLGNHKSQLQELIQAKFKSPPRYRVLHASGPDHARVFTVGVTFNGIVLGSGTGHNKKAAEQKAAQKALARLEREPDLLDAIME